MQVLRESAEAALAAPSIFNTQPWRWQVSGDVLRLWADRERQLLVADPGCRMLTISCGVALHHAGLALAAAGHQPAIQRLPDPHEPTDSSDGVPTATAVEPSHRAVPVRDFVPFGGEHGMPAGPHTDAGAQYAVVFTDEDTPLAWLQAGEALSAVPLTATSLGLGTSPISDVTELTVTREQLRHLLADIGVPQLAVWIGQCPPGLPPSAPRRARSEVIYP